MKKVLVIGSTVVDIIIDLDHLPKTPEDVHVLRQQMSLGGCAYNASDMIRHFQVPYVLFSPVGSGVYGDFVRTQLARCGVRTPIPPVAQENGCCYCFVEKSGERTFASCHGAEYLFEKEWFDLLEEEDIGSVYLCGLEIEEPTGVNIIEWLEKHPSLTLYFAPGPRMNRIEPALLNRLFALHPILHLNEQELLGFAVMCCSDRSEKSSQTDAVHLLERAESSPGSNALEGSISLEEAAEILYRQTQNTVIVTLGGRGAYYHDGCDSAGYVPGFLAVQVDTIGAGDSHIGSVIACRTRGMSLYDSIFTANRIAAKVVETKGALLSDACFSDAIQ
jgi:sugar/nucleoside kinase (ribokinase family)